MKHSRNGARPTSTQASDYDRTPDHSVGAVRMDCCKLRTVDVEMSAILRVGDESVELRSLHGMAADMLAGTADDLGGRG
jgi:hypothetical protein